jgi:5-methylcytosine-specific restriction endonuclease McrA
VSIQQSKRRKVFERDGWRCFYCNAPVGLVADVSDPRWPIALATIDHKTSKLRGGTDDPANLVTACHRCNQAKGSRKRFPRAEYLTGP